MLGKELIIGSPYAITIRGALSAPYVVLVNPSSKTYYVADEVAVSSQEPNTYNAVWTGAVTEKMIPSIMSLEVWSNSQFIELLKKEEEFTKAVSGAPTPGYINGNI